MRRTKLVILIPRNWRDLVKEAAKKRGWERVSDYIRELIKRDLEKLSLIGGEGNDEKKGEEKHSVSSMRS